MSVKNFLSSLRAEEWRAVYAEYPSALNAKAAKMKPDKAKELMKLDEWYQTQLPQLIRSRKPCSIHHDELAKLMKWKLSRGKFRPRLQQLVESNPAEEVEKASEKAFQLLPNVSASIDRLSKLKGVGPATASAVLTLGVDEDIPFMADESMSAFSDLLPLAYTMPACLNFSAKVKDIAKKLAKEDADFHWTARKVERCLWTYQVALSLSPDILDTVQQAVGEGDSGKPVKRSLPQPGSPEPQTDKTGGKKARRK